MSEQAGAANRPDIPGILEAAQNLADRVRAAADRSGYQEKGILNSEILFMLACVAALKPARIVESGRARGQSTALLALLFPDREVISFELHKGTPDDEIATRRLSEFPNVRLMYGDSLKLLPPIVRAGDVLLVDGPKGSLGIELCLRVCAAVSPLMVFMHDSHHGQLERQFAETFWPHPVFSDDPRFVTAFEALDRPCWELIASSPDRQWQAPYTRDGLRQLSYGPTMACLPAPKRRDAKWMLRELRRLKKRYPRWRH